MIQLHVCHRLLGIRVWIVISIFDFVSPGFIIEFRLPLLVSVSVARFWLVKLRVHSAPQRQGPRLGSRIL